MRRSVLIAALARVLPGRAKPRPDPEIGDLAAQFGGLIDNARRRAIADGVRPIPASVSRALLGYFPSALLQKCRYATGGCRALSLPGAPYSYGDPAAITLGEVVLFKNEQVAMTDLAAWAHQLTHVMQCQRWGIKGFAERYVHDAEAVEREAVETAKRFRAWFARHGTAAILSGSPAGSRFSGATPPGPRPPSRRTSFATFR